MTYENVSIYNDYHVLDTFRVGVKIFQVGYKLTLWSKNPPGGHKLDSKISWVQLFSTSAIKFLCIGILETLLHVILKRQAEILAVLLRGWSKFYHIFCPFQKRSFQGQLQETRI